MAVLVYDWVVWHQLTSPSRDHFWLVNLRSSPQYFVIGWILIPLLLRVVACCLHRIWRVCHRFSLHNLLLYFPRWRDSVFHICFKWPQLFNVLQASSWISHIGSVSWSKGLNMSYFGGGFGIMQANISIRKILNSDLHSIGLY